MLDDPIVAEYSEVLAGPRFRLPQAEVSLVPAAIGAAALWVEAGAEDSGGRLPDPSDAITPSLLAPMSA